MPDREKSGGTAIWVAVIGAIVTSSGYVGAYYKDLSIQEKSQEHALVVHLLTGDSRESSQNLVWAHDAQLISLSDKTVQRLRTKPHEGPTRSEGQSAEEPSFADILPSEDVVALVRGLDAGTKTLRSQALRSLLDLVEKSPETLSEAIAASVALLSGEHLDVLSANGRYNILYFLDRVDWTQIDGDTRSRSIVVLDNIVERGNEGLAAVGPKTRSLIVSIKSKIS